MPNKRMSIFVNVLQMVSIENEGDYIVFFTLRQRLGRTMVILALVALTVAGCGVSAEESQEPTLLPTDTLAPPTESATVVPTKIPGVGTDITVDLPEGNVDRGFSLARRWGCAECHVTYTHGPLFLSSDIGPSISERAASRIEDPSYTGTATAGEEYLIESILLPGVYLVEGYPTREDYAMDNDLGEHLTAQDLADILAWLQTLE